MRTDYIDKHSFELLLTALMPANRRVIELSLSTGLRLGDVLQMGTNVLSQRNRFTVVEQKTGKKRRVFVPERLRRELLQHAGEKYLFEHRTDPEKHRSRSTVYKDLKRVAKLYRLNGAKITENIAPHTARKIYAVEQFRKTGSLEKVQKLLNHDNMAVTMLYAMADELRQKK